MSIFLKKYTWVLYLLLIFIGTYFLAKIGSTMLASKIRVEKKFQPTQVAALGPGDKKLATFEDYRVVLERNIFDSREIEVAKEATPEPQGEINLEGPAVKTSLPVKIISTFSVGNGTDKRSSATISSGKGAAEIYTVEDEKQFSPGVKIVKILPDRVEFINNRRLEYAEIEGFAEQILTQVPLGPAWVKGPVLKPVAQPLRERGFKRWARASSWSTVRKLTVPWGPSTNFLLKSGPFPSLKGGKFPVLSC